MNSEDEDKSTACKRVDFRRAVGIGDKNYTPLRRQQQRVTRVDVLLLSLRSSQPTGYFDSHQISLSRERVESRDVFVPSFRAQGFHFAL